VSYEDKTISAIKTDDGKEIKDESEIANTFNDYFSSVGSNLAKNILKPTPNTANLKEKHIPNTFVFQEIYPSEVERVIHSLKNKKAPGMDNIKAELLKKVAKEIAEPLAYISNLSVETGVFPSHFKSGIVKPLFKNGDKQKNFNYRPITLISCFAKIIKVRFTSFFDKYKLISKKQFGFSKHLSTEDAIDSVLRQIYASLDKSKPCFDGFLDLAKAFDTVCHKTLLRKLQNYGFRENILKLLESYLENRMQYVKIGKCQSRANKITYGVPQGTVLGPLLFILYLNDILELDIKGFMASFADDGVIIFNANSWSE